MKIVLLYIFLFICPLSFTFPYNNESNSTLNASLPELDTSTALERFSYFSYSVDFKTISINLLNGLKGVFNQLNAVIQPHQQVNRHIGRLALTEDGTNFYKLLSEDRKTEFLSKLRIDLAKSIPMNVSKIKKITCCNYDDEDRLLLTVHINSGMKYLDTLIRKKEISSLIYTIDADFGFQQSTESGLDFRFYFFCILTGIIMSSKKHPMVIFKFSLLFLDHILSFVFFLSISNNYALLVPSIFFCLVPSLINLYSMLFFFLYELVYNKYFCHWSDNDRSLVSALISLFAFADIEFLKIHGSKIASGMNAPISERAYNNIFWGSLFAIFYKNIPMFIIKVLCNRFIITNKIIPFLSLLISSIVLVHKLVSLLFHLIAKLYRRWKYRKSFVFF